MFVGEYNCKLDSKSRTIFPSALKRQLTLENNQSFVLKRDIYAKCLLLYPISEWNYQVKILKKRLNPFNKKHAEFLREYYRGTAEIVLDASNRILFPKRLLDYIEADKELVFAGQEGKIEIWSKDNYQNTQKNHEDFADLAEDILGGDFLFNIDNDENN
jgi:MraZ protein